MGEGSVTGEGLELFDVVAKKGEKILGFCLFRESSWEAIIDGAFITRLADRLANKVVNRVIVLLDVTTEAKRDISPLLENLKKTLRDEIFTAIEFVNVDISNLREKVVDVLKEV